MWISYKLRIATGETLSVLERQNELTREEYDSLNKEAPNILRFLTLIHRSDIEDAKLGNDLVFKRRLRSDVLKIQKEVSSYQCSEKKSCSSFSKSKCTLEFKSLELKKTPHCFSIEDVFGREFVEMAIEAIRSKSILVVVVPDSILL